jgi:exopolysaccharide biosynthesis protein
MAVDGRSSESRGLTMEDLSQLCEDLGLTSAYNLDGGQSSVMQAESGAINVPYADGRPVSDALVICELTAPNTTQTEADSDTAAESHD